MSFVLLPALGILAGLITTLTGFGGGLLLVTALAFLWDPLTALTLSSLALVAGNAQRLWLFRQDWDRKLATPVILGAMPGALLGSLLATKTPEWLLQVAIAGISLLALARMLSRASFILPVRALAPGAFAVGLLSATAGGGGFLLGPLLLSAGASGNRYIAIGASAGVAIHALRIAGYASAGIIDLELLHSVLIITMAILLGNTLGKKVRKRLGERRMAWLEYAAPLLCAALALAGFL